MLMSGAVCWHMVMCDFISSSSAQAIETFNNVDAMPDEDTLRVVDNDQNVFNMLINCANMYMKDLHTGEIMKIYVCVRGGGKICLCEEWGMGVCCICVYV